MSTTSPMYRVNSPVLAEDWLGPLEELLEQNPQLPELVRLRLERLAVDEVVRPPLGPDVFEVTRVA